MSHRFPPLRPPVAPPRKTTVGISIPQGIRLADLCLTAALALSLVLALL